jgi:hypothetical protein
VITLLGPQVQKCYLFGSLGAECGINAVQSLLIA